MNAVGNFNNQCYFRAHVLVTPIATTPSQNLPPLLLLMPCGATTERECERLQPPLPRKMTPLQSDHIHLPGGLMAQSNKPLQRDGLAAGFFEAVD